MDNIVTYENLRSFAYSNDRLIKGKIKGIVLHFFGLNGMDMYSVDSMEARDYAARNILFVIPYYNPWCWMNRQTVDFIDRIVGVLCGRYGIEDPKIVSTGGSMGGMGAIVYCRYSKYTPVGCVANCPVCDMVRHFEEREDTPRTICSAYYNEDGSVEEVLKRYSPVHLVDSLPDIPYTVFHCGDDQAVNIDIHSRRFVEAMRKTHCIRYYEVPGRAHCDLTPEAWKQFRDAVLDCLEQA